jgi:hypothetical protein
VQVNPDPQSTVVTPELAQVDPEEQTSQLFLSLLQPVNNAPRKSAETPRINMMKAKS